MEGSPSRWSRRSRRSTSRSRVITGRGSTVAAAVSAFVAALLLRPARVWVQDIVDRIYDRRAYNGVRLMRQLGQRVGRDVIDPDRVREALRTALHDRQLDVFYPVRGLAVGSLVDGAGGPVDLAAEAAGRAVVPVRRAGHEIAVVVHGPIDETQLAAIMPAAATALEHARLQADLSVQVAALRASRGRIVAAGDAERRRIERDLHDGAQQRLVGLAVHIQSARRGAKHPSDADELLTFTVAQLQAGVAEIRALVHGILPPSLVSGGLPTALAELGDVTVICDMTSRPHPDIEAAAWFMACEGVANARKHAPGSPIEITVHSRDNRGSEPSSPTSTPPDHHDTGPFGAMNRRMVDTAGRSDAVQWEELVAGALAVPLPHRPTPGGAICYLRGDDFDVMVAGQRGLTPGF